MHRTVVLIGAFLVGSAFCGMAGAQSPAPAGDETFYAKSLHYTNRGIEFIYSKEHGGLERLTGMSAEKLGCLKAKCHVTSCDPCHKVEGNGKASFSRARARSMEVCAPCHAIPAKDDPDVHFQRGMACMDCHTEREIHGDGTAWSTYMQPGAMDARCESCHADLPKTASHTVHGEKLDCAVCHTLDSVTCVNCHIDARLAQGKDFSIEKHGAYFLINHGGKVKLGNFLSYVYGKKTMITMAPAFAHSVTKRGKTCDACHGTSIVDEVKRGTLRAFAWRDGEVVGVQGVVPVVEGMRWNVVFLGREGDRWVPLEGAEEPLVNYSGYCTPLSREQLARLERPQTAR